MVKYMNPLLLEVHPLNEELVPSMSPEEFEALVFDLKQNGVEQPLKLLAGTNQVIDGKNRLKGSIKAKLDKVPVEDKEISEEDLPFYILSRPAVHRHFTIGQKAALAAKFARLFSERKRGGIFSTSAIREQGGTFSTLTELSGKSRQVAAKLFGINDRYVQIALNLMKLAPESFELLERGELNIKDAQAIIAKARVQRSSDQLIPELQKLVTADKLAHEAAWHLSQLTQDEQRVLLEMVKEKGITALGEAETRKIKLVIKKSRDDQQWQQFQEELLSLREERTRLEQELAAARAATDQYRNELEELNNKVNEAANEAHPEVVARIAYLEGEVAKYTEEKQDLQARLEQVQEEMDDLSAKFFEVQARNEELQKENSEMKDTLERARKMIAPRVKKIGRKRKSIYDKHIEKLEERLARSKEKQRELRESQKDLQKVIHKLARRVVNLEVRREHLRADSALRTIIGILQGPELKPLPDYILMHHGDVLGTLELLNAAMEGMEALLEKVNDAAITLFKKLDVVDDDEADSETSSGTETSSQTP